MNRTRRIVGPTGLLLALVFAGIVASGCGTSTSGALGHQACLDVAKSLRIYAESQHATSKQSASTLATQAANELRDALQPASLAGSEDGNWQALEITLSESSRVAESNLVGALRAQCQASLASG